MEEILKLDRILGTTTLSGNSLATSPSPSAVEKEGFDDLRDFYDDSNNRNSQADHKHFGGDIFYAAGSMVVRYNCEENVQKSFYCAKKAVSSIALCTLKIVSFESISFKSYIAIAERGPSPTISIWDVESAVLIKELNQVHKYGIGCMAFSPNGTFLVSAGFRSDKQLIIWRWQSEDNRELISTQRIGNKVRSISFSPGGDFFITSGDKHLKWWFISEVLEGEALAVEGIAASILEAHRLSVFVEVIVGYGPCKGITFTVTAAGLLCQFSDTTKMMIKQVQLEIVEKGSVHCMELFCRSGTPGLLVVGLSNGSVLCFAPQSLAFVVKLPPPAPLFHAIGPSQMKEALYPACYALRKVPGTVTAPIPKLAAVYADTSFIVWDISDVYNILKHRSFLHHSACIWDLQFLDNYYIEDSPDSNESTLLPRGTFVTCSADGSIRIWNTDPKAQRKSKFRSVYSKEMLHMIGLSPLTDEKANSNNKEARTSAHLHEPETGSTDHDLLDNVAQLSCAVPDTESPVRLICRDSPRCLAVHPFGHRIVCGDRLGSVRIFDLASMAQVGTLKAHIAEVLTLSFSPPVVPLDGGSSWAVSPATNSADDDTSLIVMASAGRDRLIHVYNATKNYELLDTLDCHSSSVTTARFTTDGKRFISCSGDKTIMFHAVNGPEISTYKTVQTPGNGCINGLCVEASNKFAVTCGQDKKLNVWNVQNGRLIRSYKSGAANSEFYKCDIDPSGTYIATCGFNKTIQILDFFSGELIAQVSGHSELVTAIKFSPDGRYLLSVGGDGCIFFWKLAGSLVKTMQDRLMELYASAQRKSVRVVRQSNEPAPLVSRGLDDHTTPAAGRPVSGKWAARLDSDKGYELFGRKILPSKEKHKLTLELSGALIDDGMDPAAVTSLEDCVSISIPEDNCNVSNLVVEEDDEDEESDEDESKLFKEKDPTIEKSGSVRSVNDDTDDEGAAVHGLDIAQVKLDMLEQSAKSLENWLEDMLKGETQLDSTVHAYSDSKRTSALPQDEDILHSQMKSASKKDTLNDDVHHQAPGKLDGRDLLNQSLSSAFFSSLQAKGGSQTEKQIDIKKGQDTPVDDSRGRSIAGSSPARGTSGTSGREVKRLETQAAVSQMKERLRVMGLLEASVSMPVAEAEAAAQDEKKTSSSFPMPPISDTPKAVHHMEQQSDVFFPPLPPSFAEEDSQSSSLKVQSIAAELRRKTADYKRVLSDLDKAKQAASESFSELMQLRNSLQVVPSSLTRQQDKGDSLEESVHEADNLLHQFRQSMSSLAPNTYSSSGNMGPMATSSPRSSLFGMSLDTIDESETIAPILEKYSDKLLEMMTRKLGVELTKKS